MKRLLSAFLLLFAFSASAAVTVLSAKVDQEPQHFSLIVDFGAATSNSVFASGITGTNNAVPATPNYVLHLTRPGYDDTGSVISTNINLYVLKQMRLAYPQDTNNAAVPDGSTGVNLRMALSDYVFSGDTALTLDVAANSYSNNTAATAVSVVNNSTGKYFKSFLNWTYPGWQRISGNTMTVRCFGYHWSAQQGRPLRVVQFIWRDQHAHAVTNWVTGLTYDTTTTDAVHFGEYVANMDISTATQGDLLRVDITGYPWEGDVNAVTSSLTNATQPTGLLAPITNVCDRTAALSTIGAWVDPTNGVDATGVAGSPPLTTANKPFKNWDVAILAIVKTNSVLNSQSNLAGCFLQLTNGTYSWTDFSGKDGTNNWSWFTISNAPTVARSSIIITRSASGNIGNRLKVSNCAWTNTGGAYCVATQPYFWLDQCELRDGSSAQWGNTIEGYATANTINASYTGLGFVHFGVEKDEWPIVRGNTDLHTGNIQPTAVHGYMVVGNKGPLQYTYSGNGCDPSDPAVFYNNIFSSYANTSGNCVQAISNSFGILVLQNVFEQTNSLASKMVGLGHDLGTTGQNMTNVIIVNNTLATRINSFYNDNAGHNPLREGCMFAGNASQDSNVKTDNSIAPFNGVRTNNWGAQFGVGHQGNFTLKLQTAGSGFFPDFDGPWSNWSTNGVEADLGFKGDASFYGTGLGNGDYHLLSGSQLLRNPIHFIRVQFDIEGVSRGEWDPPGAYSGGNPRRGDFL